MIVNDRAYVVTGAPGSGKTSIMNALMLRGLATIEEPARAIIDEQRSVDGQGVYDKDPYLFKELILSRSMHQYLFMKKLGDRCFFDRGIPDVIAYSKCFHCDLGSELKAAESYRYNNTVFFAPCWQEIFIHDQDRKLSFVEAQAFAADIRQAYEDNGYGITEIPCLSPEERVDFILRHI